MNVILLRTGMIWWPKRSVMICLTGDSWGWNKARKGMTFGRKIGQVKELFIFLWQNRLWWLVPIVASLILLSFFIWITQSSNVLPFIYALF